MNPNVPRRAGKGRGDPTETIETSCNNFSCRVCVCMRTRVLLRHFVAAFVLQKLPSRVEKKRPLVMKMGPKTSRCFKVRFELPLRGINAVSTPTPRARLTVATFRSTLSSELFDIRLLGFYFLTFHFVARWQRKVALKR